MSHPSKPSRPPRPNPASAKPQPQARQARTQAGPPAKQFPRRYTVIALLSLLGLALLLALFSMGVILRWKF